MGLYDKSVDFDFSFEKFKLPIIGLGILVGLLVLFFLFQSFGELVKQKPIEVSFEKTPLKIGEQTLMRVRLTNTTEKDAYEIIVYATPKDKANIHVFATKTNKIDLLEKGNRRDLEFMVKPLGDVLPGTYTINVKATINGQDYVLPKVIEVVE